MSDNINPTGSSSQTAIDLVPKFYQTRDNVKFIQSTIDQLVQKGTTRKISGYIGRENAKSAKGTDIFIDAIDSTRQNYQFEPGVVVNDQIGNTKFFKDYIDYINQLNVFGGNTKNHERINKQEFYSWDPHIDWDKFVNFQNYYWLPYGPETITVYGQQQNVVSTYTVVIEQTLSTKEYLFTPNGLIRNPSIVLYRGQTYNFNITSVGEPFSIKTARTFGKQDRYIDASLSINNFGVTDGTVTFTVPQDAPDLLYYVSENDPNLGGIIKILDITANSSIDVNNDFLGKKTYTLPLGNAISNGMKISFGGNVTPAQYSTGEYYVEGVGTAIKLVPTTVLEVIGPYTTSKILNYDETPFDQYPLDQTSTYANSTDYIVINRSAIDKNAWSRYNRWFHKDVIALSATINGADVNIDQTARATRPIIEFEAGLKLFNFGSIAIDDVDVVDNFTIDAFNTIEGSAGYNIDGIQLTEGMRVIFLADTDPLVKNNIYVVHFINIQNAGSGKPQIHLELVATPLKNNTTLVKQGTKYQGYMFWFNETTWLYSQQKNTVNQAPLFDLVDDTKVLLSDYPGSTFSGTKIFSYKVGTGSNDAVLGFPLSYQNINNIGDIKFEFNLLTDTFNYKESDLLITKKINTGFLEKLNYVNGITYVNGWQTSIVTNYQPAIKIYKNSNKVNNFPLDIYDNKTDLLDLQVRIYINGIRLDTSKWSIIDAANYKVIKLATNIGLSDVLTIKSFARQPINSNGYYEIPINLQNNPLNDDMTMFTLGEVSDHVNSILDNIPQSLLDNDDDSDLHVPESTVGNQTYDPDYNNIKDLGNITPYGTKFVQHSSPASLSLFHIASEDNNVVKSLEKARDDYGKFKRNFIAKAQTLGTHGDAVSQVDSILQKLTVNKSKLAPYYFSDMTPFGAKKISNYTVVDSRITTYPLTNIFDNTILSNKAVSVYVGTTQLLYGLDYTFTTDGYVDINAVLTKNEIITVYEYDSTDGCYVPATPTKLGLWPKYTPKIFLDTSFITPVKMIQGHDGSLTLAYNDYRDELILELEKRIYNNIKMSYTPDIFDITSLIPGYSRNTDYTLAEFNQTLSPNFYSWITMVGADFTKPLSFDLTNAFTYNFKGHSAPDGRGVPGYWRGIYQWFYDTDRPNLFPWEMLGFAEAPSWWTSVYGPAPYTSNNLVMWTDISLGAIRAPGTAVVYRTAYAKPFLLNHLPVDESGNLVTPIQANIAVGPSTSDVNSNFIFGDNSPAESAWRKSSYYPFSVISTFMILKPSATFGLTLDKSRIARNLAGQLINTDTMLRIRPADIVIPSIYSSDTRVQTSGIINYLVDDLVHDNLNFYNNYSYSLQNLQVQLSYRIGSFTTKANFNLLLDSKNPASTGSLFVPPEDYSIIFNSSSPVKKLSYSGVIITKIDSGYEVQGYSLSKPYFSYYNYTQSSGAVTIGGISSPFASWTANQSYITGQIIFYNGIYYRTIANTNSGDTFNIQSFAKLAELPVSGGVTASFRRAWDRESEISIPYGTVLNSIQDVVDFLTGYGEWLKDQGFVFDEFNNNLSAVSNWETSAKEFMFWSTQNWSTAQNWIDWVPNKAIPAGTVVKYNGTYYKALDVQAASAVFIPTDFSKIIDINQSGNAVISLSPSANSLTFTADMAVVDDINNSFNQYEIFKVDGTSLLPADLNSIRQGNTINYIPREGGTIYNASFYLVQKEQVVILNNTTMFNDIIYNPTSGYRQEKIKVNGFVASQWFGGFEVPGFIFDRAEITEWKPYTTYYPGDIVKQGQFYLQADPTGNVVQGTATIDTTQWALLTSKPESKLIPNWTYKAGQFTDFYNLDEDNFDTGQQQIAQHLIGYQDRQYLDNIIQDKVSEFQFYQGFIKEKGTQNSLNKLFDVLSADNKESLNFYEEWALRVGQYGASSAFDAIEFILDEASTTVNPQGFHLVNQPTESASNFNVNLLPKDLYLAPLGYDSNPFPYSAEFKPFLRSGGYVQLDSTVIQLPSIDSIATETISNYKDGTFVWVPFYQTGWNIFRFTNSSFKITDIVQTSDNLAITLKNTPIGLNIGDYIGLSQVPYSGFFKVLNVSKNIITIYAPSVKIPSPFTFQDEIVLFFLLPAKTSIIDNANDLIKSFVLPGDKIWTDDDGTGHWSSWQLQQAYTKNEIVNQDSILTEFKYAVIWKPNTIYTLGTIINNAGSYYYTTHWFTSGATFDSTVSLLSYSLDGFGNTVVVPTLNQTNSLAIKSITPDTLSSFGQNIVTNSNGTVAVIYTAKGHVGTYTKASGSQPWELNQVISAPLYSDSSPLNINPNKINTFGESLALAGDGSYLAIGSPNAGFATTDYIGDYSNISSYILSAGLVVSTGSGVSLSYWQSKSIVPANTVPSAVSNFWQQAYYIPVNSYGTWLPSVSYPTNTLVVYKSKVYRSTVSISKQTTINIISTNINGNITATTTAGLVAGYQILFSGIAFGGIKTETSYYIASVTQDDANKIYTFTITALRGSGNLVFLTTATNSGGALTATQQSFTPGAGSQWVDVTYNLFASIATQDTDNSYYIHGPAAEGVISLYQQDTYGNYNLNFSIVTGNNLVNERFGQSMGFGKNTLFATAQAADGSSKVYVIRLINGNWQFNPNPITANVYSIDFGKSIVTSADNSTVAISSPSTGTVYVYTLSIDGSYTLSNTVADPNSLSTSVNFALSIVDGGYGFKNKITDVYANQLQSIPTINGSGSGLTFNLGVDTNGVMTSVLTQTNGLNYQTNNQVTVINPLGIGAVVKTAILSAGTGYTTSTNVLVGYAPNVATSTTGLIQGNVFIPSGTITGTFVSGMSISGSNLPVSTSISSVDTVTVTNVSITGFNLSVGSQTSSAKGNLAIGMVISGGSIAANTYITDQQSGTWIVNNSQSISNITVTGKKYDLNHDYTIQYKGYVTVNSLTVPAVITPDSNGTTSTLTFTDFPTLPVVVGTTLSGTGTGIATVGTPLGNSAVQQTVVSTIGTIGSITGSGPLNLYTTYTNLTGSAPVGFASQTTNATFVITASIVGTILTVSAVSSGNVDIGYVLTGTSVIAGTYVVNKLSSTTTTSSWTVSQEHVNRQSNAGDITGTLNSITVPNTTSIAPGLPIVFSTSLGGLTASTTYYITHLIDATHISVGATINATSDVSLTNAQGVSIYTINGTVVPIIGTYQNITQRYTSGTGTGATFLVGRNGLTQSYADNSATTVVLLTPGTGYKIGDTITIAGNALGGILSTNDLTFTIGRSLNATMTARITGMTPFSSAIFPIGATFTAVNLTGLLYQDNASAITITSYLDGSNNPTTAAGTSYTGIVYTVIGGSIPVAGTIADITTQTVGSITYNNVGQISTSGLGSGAVFNVVTTGGTAVYQGYTTVSVVSQGGNYAIGDTVVISGSDLGGQSPLNDLRLTVVSVPTLPAGTVVTANIDATNWTINKSYALGTIDFPVTLSGQQTVLTVAGINTGSIQAGQYIIGSGVTPNTTIISGSGNTWYLNNNFAIGSPSSLIPFISAYPVTNVVGNVTATTGSGLTVDITAVAGQVTAVKINNPGVNYNPTDQLVIVSGNNNAIITPQTTITIPAGNPYYDPISNLNPVYGYSSLTAVSGGKLVLDFVQPTGTFFVGQRIDIKGGIDAGSVGSITGYTKTINLNPSTLQNIGKVYTVYVTAVSTIDNPTYADPNKKSTSITLSLTKSGTPIAVTPGLISSGIDPLIITAYYPGVSSNGVVKLTSVSTTQSTSTDFGVSVDLSGDGTYLAIGSNLYTEEFTNQGKVSVFQLINSSYNLYQTLASPSPVAGDFFGSKVAFMNDYNTIVVYSAGSGNSTTTIFDESTTTFDLNSLNVRDKIVSSGKIIVFDRYNTNWICGETLETNNRSLDGYGAGFAVANNRIIIGAPNALDGTLQLPTGKVYVYEKSPNTYSWKQTQQQTNVPDLRKIKKAYLYNKVTAELIKHLDIIDPYYGYIAGPADQEISFKTFYDPAIYSYYNNTVYNADTLPANVDSGQAWTSQPVGKLWWDLRTAKFIDNHSTDLVYRTSTLNTLIVGASIDIYEWIETTYLPSQWLSLADTVEGLSIGISGKPLYGDNIYSVKQVYNPYTGGFNNVYYYWVKNTIITPALATRKISAASVSNLIKNPKGEGYQYLSLTGTDSFTLSNTQSLLKSKDVVLAIEYWKIDNTTQNVHNQWKLVSDNPSTQLPATIEQKWFDSLCGKDQADRVVPDFDQPPKLRYGVENRPRQSMFVNRFEALKQFVEQVNLILINNQIVEQRPDGIHDLESYDTEPTAVSGSYDSTQDTDAELQYVSVNYIKTPTITAVILNGIITGINIVNAGSGYLIAPTVTITGSGTGASITLTINSAGEITGAVVSSGGKGYTDATILTVRPFSVLVHQDSNANKNWSIYGYDPIKKSWNRTRTQNFDVRLFWSKVDWYGSVTNPVTGITQQYNQYSIIDFAVDTYSELNSIDPAIGQTVKIRTAGNGGWQLLHRVAYSTSTDWTRSYQVVGIENGTIQLNNSLYNYTQNKVGYDGFLYDNSGYDFSASKELRIILNSLKDKILTDTLRQNYLDLFFSSIRYAFNEQTYIDWAFKTSFVQAQHNLGQLKQTVVYTNDNLSDFQNYVNEVTPYRTTVREYVDNYEAVDTSSSMLSDFDLPVTYSKTGNKVIETRVQNGSIIASDYDTLNTYPWKNWNDNLGFILQDIAIISGGSGYLSAPEVIIQSQSGKGAVAKAFIANGSVNRIVILKNGSGYLEAPTVILNGGLPHNSKTPARVTAIIGKSVVRSSLIKIKFDRVNQQYFAIQLDQQEIFTGNGSQVQFPLIWAPDIKIGQSTITINKLIQLRETYTLSIKKTTQGGYTRYLGAITFVTAPAAGSTIVVNYIKDISILEAQDRIQFFYNPGIGSLGKDLSQLMTGIDYGGVQLVGLGYDAPQGWGSTGFMNDLWDSYDETYNNYSTAVTSETITSHVFTLPYTPPVYTNLNIYYTQRVFKTFISDGTTTLYTGSPYFNKLSITATITKKIQNISTIATSTSSVTVTITGTRAVYNYLYGPTNNLTVGQAVKFTANVAGGLVLNQTYYIKTILDSNTFTITSAIVNGQPDVTTVVTTQSIATMSMIYDYANNVISANSSNLAVGMPIQFTGTPIGGIQNNVTYYIKSVLANASGFTISASYKNGTPGAIYVLSSGIGSMAVNQVAGAGYSTITLDSTTGLKIGDSLVTSVANSVTPETTIKSIDSPFQITLSTILYGDIPNSSTVQFVRTLAAPVDYLFITNVDIRLASPIVAGGVINFTAYQDPVRIDDSNYNKSWTITNTSSVGNIVTAYEVIDFNVGDPIDFSGNLFGGLTANLTYVVASVINNHQFTISQDIGSPTITLLDASGKMTAVSIANPNAVMATYVADGIDNRVILPQDFNLDFNDIITFTNSTSDGSIQTNNSNVDTLLQGGDLAYTTATGLNPDDILIDGDGFVTTNTSPATEEVVPGQVVDTLAIKVFERPTGGSPVIKLSNYTADGISNRYLLGQYINTKQAVVVKSNNTILINGFGLTDTLATQLVNTKSYTITFVGTTDFTLVGASANTVGLSFIATGPTTGTGTVTTADYNVDYRNQEIVFLQPPAAGTLLSINSFGFNGSNVLDLDYYTGDGVTNEFITKANWSTDVNILVYIDGLPQSPEVFETDVTYEKSGRIAFRFTNPPSVNSVLNYLIISGSQQTYSLVKTEKLATDGITTTFNLTNTVGSSLPLESSIIVSANNRILKGPNSSYFTIGSNNYQYTLDASVAQPYSLNASQLQIYADGALLTLNKDYTVDVSGITVSINRVTYRTYKGKTLQVMLIGSADYTCTANSITFSTAYSNSDYVTVLSAYQHDILKIERSVTKASTNLTFSSKSPAFYKYVGIIGGVISLQSSVLDENYFWVVKNGILLSSSVDYKLNPDLISITLAKSLIINDVIEIILFTGTLISNGYSYMQFKDMLNRTIYKRLSKEKQTRLAQDLNFYDSYIYVNDAGNFDKPNRKLNRPGVIEIHGERIEFFTIDENKLGQLRRGTLGTGTPSMHLKGTYVQDIGPSETLPYADKTNTYQQTINGTTIDTIIPLNFIPMNPITGVTTRSSIDNWALTGSNFNIFDSTITQAVTAKTGSGPYLVTFAVPQLQHAPATGKILNVSGSYNQLFNGQYKVVSSDTTNNLIVVPTADSITGTFGVITVLDDGDANETTTTTVNGITTTNNIITAVDDGGNSTTIYSATDLIVDGANSSQNGSTQQGSVVYSFVIPTQQLAPTTGVYYTISGTVPAQYNGTFLCSSSTTASITIVFPINYGQITVLPTAISSTNSITLSYPSDPGIFNSITTTTISAPVYGQADDIDVFVGGYDTSTVWEPSTTFTADQIVTINSYSYRITTTHISGKTFNSLVTTLDSTGNVLATGVTATSVRQFFVGNTRLKKHPYSIYNVDIAPDSPAGDVSFIADFAVDSINNEIMLSNKLTPGTTVTIIKKTGTIWATDTGNITTSNTSLAKFLKLKAGISYQGLPKISTVSTTNNTGVQTNGIRFDNTTNTFDSSSGDTFDQG